MEGRGMGMSTVTPNAPALNNKFNKDIVIIAGNAND
jgi:hypothetical protein